MTMKTALREHHVYILHSLDDDANSFGYDYDPNGKPYWDE